MKYTRSALMIAAAAPALFFSAPANAQSDVQVARFNQVELRGGGNIVVRHGPVQRVRLLRGSQEMTGFTVDGRGRLRIDACRRSCRNYNLRVEIVTPRLDGLAITGGGEMNVEGTFPAQGSLDVAVTGGGIIDTRALAPRRVSASVTGGGSILTDPESALTAAVRGGGLIRYWGDPQVTQAVSGGGAVVRASR